MGKKYFFSSSLLLVLTVFGFVQCQKSSSVAPVETPTTTKLVQLGNSSSLGSYLTDKDGYTLYFFAMDANGANNCTGGCTTNWPVFNSTGLTQDKLGTSLLLTDFGTILTPNGNQVTYKGWPLYYFAPGGVKEAANSTSGDGVNGLWFVAKPDYTIMLANAQLVGQDGVSYVVSASNLYTAGTGNTTYFTDGAGRTLYAFSKDSANINKYTKADLSNNAVWPMYETNVAVVPSILDKTLFSSISVYGKTQLTYNGWPMYYYGSDVDAVSGAFRGSNKGISVPKPNVWPAFQKSSPPAPTKTTPGYY